MPSAPPRLAESDVRSQNSRLVLALEGDEVAAAVENGDGERRKAKFGAFFQRGIDDGTGLGQGDIGHGTSPRNWRLSRGQHRLYKLCADSTSEWGAPPLCSHRRSTA
jgi:hypothetical protein